MKISTYFEPVSVLSATVPGRPAFPWGPAFVAIWLIGISMLLFRWFRRWLTIHRAAGRATKMPFPSAVPIFSSPVMIEPGVFGLFRPVLLLPEGIADRLTSKQFDAIVAHELRHVQCFDNLTAAVHMGIETLFWFHPLVWWIGGKLMDERERDCDEAVLRQGSQPGDYARGIVHVCETYVKTELSCASGISGSDLKKRVREIMTWRGSLPVTVLGKAMLASAAIATILVPLAIGVLRAQTTPPAVASQSSTARALKFDVASVRVSQSQDMRDSGVQYLPGGRFLAKNRPVGYLILDAFNTLPQLVVFSGADQKTLNLFYDIEAVAGKDAIPTGTSEEARSEKLRLMLQGLLADRFKLAARREVKIQPVYAIVIANSGPKLQKAAIQQVDCEGQATDARTLPPCHVYRGGPPSGIQGQAIDMSDLARALSGFSERPVIDKTGLSGLYSIQTSGWTDLRPRPIRPDGGTEAQRAEDAARADPSRPSITGALDALGLKLEAQTAPIETIFIDHIEPASAN
jgi:uncharacterized protein (TIGR03435 family)